jgi:fibronectin type 3 domain-containing protein
MTPLRRLGRWMGFRIKEALVGLAVSSWLMGIALPARAATSGQIVIGARILNPPNAITDFVAAPVGSTMGDVQLTWTAPANLNGSAIDRYHIRYATFPAPSVPQAETWWTNALGSQAQLTPAQNPGVQEFMTLGGLTVGVTYYFGIKSIDVDGMTSAIDTRTGLTNQAASQPLNTAPSTPTGFTGVVVSSASVQWSWNLTFNATSYSLYSHPADALVGSTTNTFILETGLSANNAIVRTVRASNASGLSAPTAPRTVYTLANAPNSLSITTVTATTIGLSWSANGNSAGTQYRIERSPDNSVFTYQAQQTQLTYNDSGLSPLTSYYYRVLAYNGDAIATAPSAAVSTVTLSASDVLAPEPPMGLKGSLDPSETAFTLLWEAVNQNADGTPLGDLAGYNIYKRNTLSGAATKLNPVPTTLNVFADQVNGQTFYYTVRAVDQAGNESADSLMADSSSDENVIFLASDGFSSVVMPEPVNNLLRSAYNKYGVPLTITLSEEPVPNDTAIVRNVRLNLVRGDTGEVLRDLSFAKPQSIIGIAYNLMGGEISRGEPSLAPTPALAGVTPDQLSIYWNNGVTWIKIGGTLDMDTQSIKTRSSFLGNYQLRITPRATSLSLEQGNVFPRVFTPNGDGFNDRVYFVLENPNNAGVRGEILDMHGRKVSTLPGPSNTGVGTTLIWDGKDTSGSVVPAGAYLYKIEGEGKTFTGTVAVAR